MARLIGVILLALTMSASAAEKVVLCTASDALYFDHLINFIGSVHRVHSADLEAICVYDLGLTPEQKQYLATISKLEVCDVELTHPDLLRPVETNHALGKMVPGWYAWKPVIIKQMLDRYPVVLYLDAGITVLRPLTQLFAHIAENGYFLTAVEHSIKCSATQYVIDYFKLNTPERQFVLADDTRSLSANVLGVSRAVYDSFVLPMYKLTFDMRCFIDDGTAQGGFGSARHDQTLWSIYACLCNLTVQPPGWTFLKIGDAHIPFHSHWVPARIGPYTSLYHSRWDYKKSAPLLRRLNFPHVQDDVPYFDRFIRYKDNKKNKLKVDSCIFSYDRPIQLYALLESMQRYMADVGDVAIVYRTSGPEYEVAYQTCFAAFADRWPMHIIAQRDTASFKELTLTALRALPHDHVMFAVDDIVIKDTVDLADCAAALEVNRAHGCYLRLGKNITECYTESIATPVPPHRPVGNGLNAYIFSGNKGDWGYPSSLDMTVYAKELVMRVVPTLDFNNPNRLEGAWASQAGGFVGSKASDMQRVGLFFESSKIVNIPLNLVQNEWLGSKNMGYPKEELLKRFQEGLKIDITQYYRVQNVAAHKEMVPVFISRIE